jgi:hypothetical protein
VRRRSLLLFCLGLLGLGAAFSDACVQREKLERPQTAAIAVPPPRDAPEVRIAPAPEAASDASSCGDCPPREVVAATRWITRAVADRDGVYFWESRPGGERLLHLDRAGEVAELAGPRPYGELATDEASIFWINDDGIFVLSKGGGAVRTLFSHKVGPASAGTGPWEPPRMALDATHVYWTSQQRKVARVPKQGGPAETLTTTTRLPRIVAVDGNDVYWVEFKSGGGEARPSAHALLAQAKSGRTKPRLIFEPIRTLLAIAADDDDVYWIGDTNGYTHGTLQRVSKRGGAVVTLVPEIHTFYADGLVMDAQNLYWLEYPSSLSGPMRVRTLPKRGGEPRTLASPYPTANKIFLDPEHLYWADRGIFAIDLPR